jgi:pyridoxamine 5'-phosphate oxidase
VSRTAEEGLRREDLDPDPFVQLERWWRHALDAEPVRPDAMAVATVDREGRPSVRMVLLKGFDRRGFVFFTNYESRKAREVATNDRAAVALYWPTLHRQVRATGRVTRVSSEESERYFATRPREARLAAWASAQSKVITSRDELEKRYHELEAEFAGRDVTLPPFWGGLRLQPEEFEFWQGRENRLHDRFRYLPAADGAWKIDRLAP